VVSLTVSYLLTRFYNVSFKNFMLCALSKRFERKVVNKVFGFKGEN
jgi:hypothetical protein